MQYVLELNEDQLRIVSVACEFYTRVRMGQFQEITSNCMEWKGNLDDFCERREYAETSLYWARKYIYPELIGRGHSYGIGKFKDADRAFDIYQVARHALGDERPPWSVHELPKITVKGGTTSVIVKKCDSYGGGCPCVECTKEGCAPCIFRDKRGFDTEDLCPAAREHCEKVNKNEE